MKTAVVHEFSVRDIRQSFHRVLRWIENGEEVLVTKHRKVVAKVVPPACDRKTPEKPNWPDFMADLNAIYGDKPPLDENMVVWSRKRERH